MCRSSVNAGWRRRGTLTCHSAVDYAAREVTLVGRQAREASLWRKPTPGVRDVHRGEDVIMQSLHTWVQ